MADSAVGVPVLIVGGGPVGLTASILLSQAGVRSLLIERHPGTAVHPKARGINARTMEMYRQLGVEAAIRQAGLPPERAGRRGEPGAQLPVRPGRPRAGAARLRRTAGPGPVALQCRACRIRP